METALSINDPLADQEVTITITLPADERPRAERPVLVGVGTATQPPVTKAGCFAALTTLIAAAWTACGVQTPQPPADRPAATATTAEVIDEADVDAAPLAADPPPPPQPQNQNLTLF